MGQGRVTSDTEIERRRWLMIDYDPKRPKDVSSTEDEHEAAFKRARKIRDWLSQRAWREPILADSGNGVHLLYRIDLANNKGAEDLFSRVLAKLPAEFDDEVVQIDKGVFNATRLTNAYATAARKGVSVMERPHRLGWIQKAPKTLTAVPLERLEALVAPLTPVSGGLNTPVGI